MSREFPIRRAWWPMLAAAALALVLLVVGLIRNDWWGNGASTSGAWVGQRAPVITLPLVGPPGAEASRVRVGDQGATLLFFWGPGCTVCKTVTPSIDALAAEPSSGVRILTISGEDADDIRGYLKARRMRFDVLHDADYGAHAAWRVRSIPRTLIFDAEGVVRFDHVGTLTRAELDAALADLGPT